MLIEKDLGFSDAANCLNVTNIDSVSDRTR